MALSFGVLEEILQGSEVAPPILELRGLKPLDGQRYTVHLADGRYLMRGVVVAAAAQSMVRHGDPVGLRVRLQKFKLEVAKNREHLKFLLILEAEVVRRADPDEQLDDHTLQKLPLPMPAAQVAGNDVPFTQAVGGGGWQFERLAQSMSGCK
ncbi:unnamed protein product [Effrenium voratum]|uniref:Uncharacterized protein n=1 Tax=Effrenium voratum TaxID=2562239 RepID=A0AA36JAX4_9DINO|nr:unnamed protein product [Effrenium voratum]